MNLLAAGCLLFAALTGCEALQRKLTRKPKLTQERLTPIITFEDYTTLITPEDRYRKHYLMFDYWNAQLLEALQDRSINLKRIARSAETSFAELQALRDLLQEERAVALSTVLQERAAITRQLQAHSLTIARVDALRRVLERQARDIHRDFFWRDVDDHIKR